jgi:hypothetical protein
MSTTDCVFICAYVRLRIAFDNLLLIVAIRNRLSVVHSDAGRRSRSVHAVPNAREARAAGRGLRPLVGRRPGPTRGGAAPRSGAVRGARGARDGHARGERWSAGSQVRTGGVRPCASARVDQESRLAVPASLLQACARCSRRSSDREVAVADLPPKNPQTGGRGGCGECGQPAPARCRRGVRAGRARVVQAAVENARRFPRRRWAGRGQRPPERCPSQPPATRRCPRAAHRRRQQRHSPQPVAPRRRPSPHADRDRLYRVDRLRRQRAWTSGDSISR